MRRLEEASAQAAGEIGLSEDDFQACMMKYQRDPRFMTRIAKSQMEQEALKNEMLSA